MRRVLTAILALLIGWSLASPANALQLAPFKDDLFRYSRVIDSRYGGDYEVIEYIKLRDLKNRDQIFEQKVYGEYVDMLPWGAQQNFSYTVDGRTQRYITVGRTEGASAVVIYLHGQGGSRFQGANDWMFGGNFNRIKNLMLRNGGLYISPDFTDFADDGAADIKGLVRQTAAASPGAPIFIACGSFGGVLCWKLAEDPSIAKLLGGILLLGSVHDDDYLNVVARRPARPLPIVLAHGSWDPVLDWKGQATFFEKVKALDPSYPIKLVVFDTGKHGTPIRMIDWRLVLNWMLTKQTG
ncbi:alpha/beta hydrolase [Segnochrobactrum spirostomi]|uniref:Alpha/beta hydrolase n=1 Tax=Segnochrobactrum spirostomi TaxID=2608987 RepID=A0A6A7XXY8_9HYPH|nr:alpha/beta hydrolase [Segnochrobactrum spirostomi]MQT11540.1 alpha/beta hydrolase [Segnochrobactrum spirostomi]